MKKITFIKDIETGIPWHTKKLWLDEDGYILTSAVDNSQREIYETMVFEADSNGEMKNGRELGVVHKLNHEAALADAGYDYNLP